MSRWYCPRHKRYAVELWGHTGSYTGCIDCHYALYREPSVPAAQLCEMGEPISSITFGARRAPIDLGLEPYQYRPGEWVWESNATAYIFVATLVGLIGLLMWWNGGQ